MTCLVCNKSALNAVSIIRWPEAAVGLGSVLPWNATNLVPSSLWWHEMRSVTRMSLDIICHSLYSLLFKSLCSRIFYAQPGCIYLNKSTVRTVILWNTILCIKIIKVFYFNIVSNAIYSCDAKLNFQQSSVSHQHPSEIILIRGFFFDEKKVKQTVIILFCNISLSLLISIRHPCYSFL